MSQPQHEPPSPAAVMQLLQGAQASAILSAAIELGVFAKLNEGPLDADQLAAGIRSPTRTTRILADALCVLGLASKTGGKYQLTPLAADHLVPGKPMYMGDVSRIFASPNMWSGMGRLSEAVRAGGSVLESHAETPANSFWETFAQSSAAMAFPGAMALDGLVHEWIAKRPRCRVLDIAAGSGIYGYTLAKHPNVELTCLDWPNVLEETKNWAPRLGVDASRVHYRPGNLFEVDYGGPYDLVLLSHVYHHFDAPTCAQLTRKVAAALAPGGRVAVQDMVHDETLANPGATMFSVIMMIWTRKGESFTFEDYRRWFLEAGLSEPTLHPSQGMPSSWLMADKR